MMELTGRIKLIMDEQKFDSGFFKKDFVITTAEQYPQDILFTLNKERSELLNAFKVGDQITVQFDVRGREWNDKYFVNLVAWKLQAAESAPNDGPPPAPETTAFPTISPVDVDSQEDDDLPF
jgi:single-strand DNA-binding protein